MGTNAKTLGNPHSLDLITEKLLKLVNGWARLHITL